MVTFIETLWNKPISWDFLSIFQSYWQKRSFSNPSGAQSSKQRNCLFNTVKTRIKEHVFWAEFVLQNPRKNVVKVLLTCFSKFNTA